MRVMHACLCLALLGACGSSDGEVTTSQDSSTDTFQVVEPDAGASADDVVETVDVAEDEDTGPQCEVPTPFYSDGLDRCCECLVGTHCTSGACTDDCACAPPGKDCALCGGATPHCLTENGQFVDCVACLSTEDCEAEDATCENYICTTPPPDPPEIDGIPVTCQAGECWGSNGQCNGDTVVCKGGAQCVTLDYLFEGQVPDGVIDPGGFCQCDPTPGALPGTEQGDCPDGLLCGPGPLQLLVALIDGSVQVPTHCYEDK